MIYLKYCGYLEESQVTKKIKEGLVRRCSLHCILKNRLDFYERNG